MRVYGLDDMRRYPPETIAAWTANLPAGSQTWRRLDVDAAWPDDTYLLATLVDQMNLWLWANSDPGKRGPCPKPIPRPGARSGSHGESGDGKDVRTRTIRPMALSKDELDAFMRRRFTDKTP